MATTISVEIVQHGNPRWPGVGDAVVMDGAPYRVVATNGLLFARGEPGDRFMFAEVEAVDWGDVPEGEEYPHTVRPASAFPSVGVEAER